MSRCAIRVGSVRVASRRRARSIDRSSRVRHASRRIKALERGASSSAVARRRRDRWVPSTAFGVHLLYTGSVTSIRASRSYNNTRASPRSSPRWVSSWFMYVTGARIHIHEYGMFSPGPSREATRRRDIARRASTWRRPREVSRRSRSGAGARRDAVDGRRDARRGTTARRRGDATRG